MPMKNPPHPGGKVLRDCIEPPDLSIADAAEKLGVSHFTLSELENGKREISPRNGGAAVQGVWRQRRELACAAGAVRSRTGGY